MEQEQESKDIKKIEEVEDDFLKFREEMGE